LTVRETAARFGQSDQTAGGVPVTEVAAQLGHSRISLTLDVYSHVLMAD
jgi:hypothetical protein